MVNKKVFKFSLSIVIFLLGTLVFGAQVMAIKICECNLVHKPTGSQKQRDPQQVRWVVGLPAAGGKYMTGLFVSNAGWDTTMAVSSCLDCKTAAKDKVKAVLKSDSGFSVESCYNCEATAIDATECKKQKFEWNGANKSGTPTEYLGKLNGTDPWYPTTTPKIVEMIVNMNTLLGTPKVVCGSFGCDGKIIELPSNPMHNNPIKIHTDKVGNLNILLKSEIAAISPTDDCVEMSTTTIYFMVNYNCADQMKDASGNLKDCSKESDLADCKEKCINENCVWSGGAGGACISKPTDIAAGGVGTGDVDSGITVANYGADYFIAKYPKPTGYAGALPDCAFSGTCRDTNDLVLLIIKFGQGMFAILGSFAFAFFVYGGFTMIISFGNAEKIKKGQGAMVAALVGLLIAFGAYLAVDLLLDTLNVGDIFRGIK